MKGYWFAAVDDNTPVPYVWQPCLETEEGHIPCFEVWFETQEACEEWIEKYVIGRKLRRD